MTVCRTLTALCLGTGLLVPVTALRAVPVSPTAAAKPPASVPLSPAASAAPAPAAQPSSAQATTITVKFGDTLLGISKTYFGSEDDWKRIAAANNLQAPFDIEPGQALLLPAGAKIPEHAAPKHRTRIQAASDAVPDFSLAQVSNGKTFRLRDHLGEVVLIDFWATWCGPCRMAIPHLIELQKRYHNQNFTVVGVSVDQQGAAVVRPFTEQWNINYPVVVDQDGSVARDYGGIRGIPTTVVIDKTGRAVGALVGYRPLEEYEALIKKAMKAG